jgi:NAD(P)-dependent dehydrogenase (short-subunit alcohol dehydrogenase family)
MRLAGKAAIVTGAGRGIGRAIALSMASEGARLALAARSAHELNNVVNEIRLMGGDCIAVPTDVTDPIQVRKMAARATTALGGLDILINNAGIAGTNQSVEDLLLQQWHEVLDSNLTSAFLCTQAVVPFMKEKGGRIVNLSSVAAKTGLPFRAGYSAAKAGIIGFTRAMALELGRYQITVNCVVPGAVSGERLTHVILGQAERVGQSPLIVEEQMKQRSPLGRLIPPEDVASAILWLVGPSGQSVTGEDVNISAGAVMF